MERDWSSWPQEYYSTTDRDERKKLLQERLESGTADEKDQIRMKFWELRDRKSTRLNSSHSAKSRMPSSA